jgi:saccharopine dehydrogenase-like NADP-dependent oxidoreductase
MRILVVGSGGVGAAVAPIAARRDFFEKIVFADYDEFRARSVVERYSTDRFEAARVDASDAGEITELIRTTGATHVLNAVDPRFVMPIFQGCFAADATYLDMAMSLSEPHPDEPHEKVGKKLGDDQFAVAEAWEGRGLLALVGVGVEPGMSDVFARYAAEHLFSSIDDLGVRDGANIVVRAITSRQGSRSGRRSRSASIPRSFGSETAPTSMVAGSRRRRSAVPRSFGSQRESGMSSASTWSTRRCC